MSLLQASFEVDLESTRSDSEVVESLALHGVEVLREFAREFALAQFPGARFELFGHVREQRATLYFSKKAFSSVEERKKNRFFFSQGVWEESP